MGDDESNEIDISSLSLDEPLASVEPNQYFVAKQTATAGVGAFATTKIPAGTRILCEPPLFALPDDAEIIELYQTVIRLPLARQKPYWALAASTKPHRDLEWIATLRASHDESLGSFEDLVEEHELAMSIFETNRFTLRSSDGTSDRMGFFPNAARFNHSCAPNVFHRFNANINCLTVHALRDIEEGEEIYTSYIDICHDTAERRRILRHWGFKCRCSACSARNSKQDWRRRKLEDLMSRMKRAELKRPHETWAQWDYAKALDVIEEIIALMKEEGMEESDTLGEAYSNAAEYALGLRWRQPAIEWAELAREIERKCLGDDSPEFAKADALLESAQQS